MNPLKSLFCVLAALMFLAASVKAQSEAIPVNGLKLLLSVNENYGECDGCARRVTFYPPRECRNCPAIAHSSYCKDCAKKLARCAKCGVAIPEYLYRFQNVSDDRVSLGRGRFEVFLARQISDEAPPQKALFKPRHIPPNVEKDKSTYPQRLDPWGIIAKPEIAGRYLLWIEYEQLPYEKQTDAKLWQGRLRSNSLLVEIEVESKTPDADKGKNDAERNKDE